MKALILAAALALPLAARADDPKYDTAPPPPPEAGAPAKTGDAAKASDAAFSEAKVLNKIHKVNAKHVELGQLIQTRGGTDKIRKFGAKLVKDHEKLDKEVVGLAEKRDININESFDTEASAAPVPAEPGAVGSADMNAPGQPGGNSATNPGGNGMGTAAPNSYGESSGPGTAYEKSGSSTASAQGSEAGKKEKTGAEGGTGSANQPATDSMAKSDTAAPSPTAADAWAQKMDSLKNLQGAEFDSQCLTDVIDSSDAVISKLQGFKGHGDKKLNGLVDKSIKMLEDHKKEAVKLQQKTPAA